MPFYMNEKLYTEVINLKNISSSKNVEEDYTYLQFNTTFNQPITNLYDMWIQGIYYSNTHHRYFKDSIHDGITCKLLLGVIVSNSTNEIEIGGNYASANLHWNGLINESQIQFHALTGVSNTTNGNFEYIFEASLVIPEGSYETEELLSILNTNAKQLIFKFKSVKSTHFNRTITSNGPLQQYEVIAEIAGEDQGLLFVLNNGKITAKFQKIYKYGVVSNVPNNASGTNSPDYRTGSNPNQLWRLRKSIYPNDTTPFFVPSNATNGSTMRFFFNFSNEVPTLARSLGFDPSTPIEFYNEEPYEINNNFSQTTTGVDMEATNYETVESKDERLNIHSNEIAGKLVTLPSRNVENVTNIIHTIYHANGVGIPVIVNPSFPLKYRFKDGASLNNIDIYVTHEDFIKVPQKFAGKINIDIAIRRVMA